MTSHIALIVVCCYIIGEMYKLIMKKKTYKYIPIVTAIFGGALGLLIYKVSPNAINTTNPYDAIMIGIMSGTSSTGTNQIINKIFKKGEKENGN